LRFSHVFTHSAATALQHVTVLNTDHFCPCSPVEKRDNKCVGTVYIYLLFIYLFIFKEGEFKYDVFDRL
jgi:hypothetical protein